MYGLYANSNVINFLAGNTMVQIGGEFKTKVESVKALKGLKMRSLGLGGKLPMQQSCPLLLPFMVLGTCPNFKD